jgi:fibronectin-binding autotransporter adhesin
VFAQYGTISSNVRSRYGAGDIDTTAYGLNATLTWYGGSGFYADGQAQLMRYDSDLHSATAGRELATGVDGTGYGFSIEAGQRFAFARHWSVTPQGQLGYSRVRFDDFTDAFGADVSLDRSRSLLGRFGIAANYDADWLDSGGKANRAHLYGIVNLYRDFAGRSEVDVSDTGFSSRNDRMSGGIGAGGSLDWADGKYSLYGEVQLRSSLKNNMGGNNAITGTIGFRARL